MQRTREAFIQHLKDNGLRVTAGKMAVFDAVQRLESHFSQQDLFDQLKASGRVVHRATVYRVLPLLEQAGIIRHVHFHDGAEARYEHHFDHQHHDHLRCLACGRVIEITRPKLEEEKRSVCHQYGFEPVDHRFWVVGYCSRCHAKLARRAASQGASTS